MNKKKAKKVTKKIKPSKIKGVDFIMYNVSDLNKSIAFYRDILGLEPFGEPGESWAEFQVGNVTLDLGTFDNDAISQGGSIGGASVGLAVDDVKKTVKELKGKGVKILYEFYETPVCFGATIADPDGNKIHFHKRKDGTFGD